jgi:hypothetical protein
MYVYLQAYLGDVTVQGTGNSVQGTASATAPAAPKQLIAFVSLYQGGVKVMETRPEEVSPEANTRLGVAPMNFSVDLSGLKTGKYDCQVTVLDPDGGKGSFWQAPILVVQ